LNNLGTVHSRTPAKAITIEIGLIKENGVLSFKETRQFAVTNFSETVLKVI
jgi:hypothetical protein